MLSPTFKDTAFFSTCNNAYIPKSITSLLSIREHLPQAKLFIFSRNISPENRQIMQKLNIEYFDLDLRGKFFRHWVYPVECYYLFAAPEKLLELGYKYSFYVDGDILCLKNPLKHVGFVKGVAGTAVGDCRGVFLDDYEAIKTQFNLTPRQVKRPRLTSSIVIFNNKKMQSISFLSTASEYFKVCLAKNIPRKGDDSLFSLIQLTDLKSSEVKNLGQFFNYMPNLFGQHIKKEPTFMHFIEQKPWFDYPTKTKPSFYPYIKKWQSIFAEHFEPTWSKDYQEKQKQLRFRQLLDEAKRLSKLEKHGLVLTAKQRNTHAKKKPLKLFISEDQHLGITNFGDEVQKDIVPTIFGYRVKPCSSAKDAELFSVGSILFELPNMDLKKNPHVWGSGFISNKTLDNESEIIKKVTFNAVRGTTTLQRIQPYIKQRKPLALGDPGLLASIIYPENPNKTNKIGVVPHYIDADNPLVEKLRQDNRFLVIDPLEPPREVAKQISSCKLILSSSLHGLIFSDSYGIPNAHICLSDKVYGGEYKFDDYDSATGKKHLHADIDRISDQSYLKTIQKQYKPIKNLTEIQKNLIKAFPKY